MFDLHKLGWHSFQQLCLTISREVFGQTVESFLDSGDAGQDGAFTGTWMPMEGEVLSGRFVIQAKFTSKIGCNLKLSDLSEEVKKAERLARNGRCSVYILLTNYGLSGRTSELIAAAFKNVGIEHFRAYGHTWICDLIRDSKHLRMMVPRVYGLGDLTQILDARIYRQSAILLDSMREDLAKVVMTDAYRKAAEALEAHSFVLLVGEAAAGKTTIASMLSIAALDQWGASTMKLEDAKGVIEHWNPDEPTQFFWIDDAFGVMQYESALAGQWNHIAPQVNAMIRKGAKLVMTSRDYIYKRARQFLKESAFPLLEESKVVIDVQELSLNEKREILYNHIKLGAQPRSFRRSIKPLLEEVATNTRFIPEVARRLGNPLFTKYLSISRNELTDFVEKQEEFLYEVMRGLDDHSKAALALIYMRNGVLTSPVDLAEPEKIAIERVGSHFGPCLKALESMEGSLVRYLRADSSVGWTFKHPTVGDAFSRLLLSPELLGIYLHGAPVEKLVGQITCGDVGLERAVVVPRTLFAVVIERLKELLVKRGTSPKIFSLCLFLSERCSREFLSIAIEKFPEALSYLANPAQPLNASVEVSLAVKLNDFELLPEENRLRFVEDVSIYAQQGEDFGAVISPRVRSVFNSEELDELRFCLESELLPNLDDIRRDAQRERDRDVEPAEHMQYFLDALAALREEFVEDPAATQEIVRQQSLIESWIDEESAEDEERNSGDPRFLSQLIEDRRSNFGEGISAGRTIFDDIDE